MVEPAKSEVAQFVRQSIVSVPLLKEMQVEVEEEGIVSSVVNGKTWWRVPIIPHPWPQRMAALYEALAEAEGHLLAERNLDILMFPDDPVRSRGNK